MINNASEILTQSTNEIKEVLKKIVTEFIEEDQEKSLSINRAEKILGSAIENIIKLIMDMAGGLLSNISEQDNRICEHCERILRTNKKLVPLTLMTLYGKLTIKRDELHCRACGGGRGLNDGYLQIFKKHRITHDLCELVTYVGQLVASFEEGKETIKKFLGFMGVEVSTSQIRKIAEEIGEKVHKLDKIESEKIYNEPEKYIPTLLEKDKREGVSYTLVDGSQVNTRIQDENGSSWKEMKLVEGFSDKDIINRKNGDSVIVKKEYGAIFGSVENFKKEVLRVALGSGYGLYRNHVVLGDGAAWIWNMSKELFPDAIEILDFYHVSENTHDYAKVLYPNDEVSRNRWANIILDKLKNGKEDEAIELIDKDKLKIRKFPKGIVNLPEYLKNNRTRIRYKYFKELGYYIGSGAIESGNKTVIQQRMKQAGMRWSASGGQYIATLRSKYKSNIWNKVVEIIAC